MTGVALKRFPKEISKSSSSSFEACDKSGIAIIDRSSTSIEAVKAIVGDQNSCSLSSDSNKSAKMSQQSIQKNVNVSNKKNLSHKTLKENSPCDKSQKFSKAMEDIGKENKGKSRNESNRHKVLGKYSKVESLILLQMRNEMIRQRLPLWWQTNDSLLGIGTSIIKMNSSKPVKRKEMKLDSTSRSSSQSNSPTRRSSIVSVDSQIQSSLHNGNNSIFHNSTYSYSQSSAYDSDDIISSLGGDFGLSDWDKDKDSNTGKS
jgi:hypothetical protein